jgi:hypothetical protein
LLAQIGRRNSGHAREAAARPRWRPQEARECTVYGVTDAEEIGRVLKSYRDFVALCARKEKETGEPCLIIASY